MAYLQPADYPNYGLPAGTTADWITAATALINSYCRRPDLNVIQYTERLRVTSGAQTVRLSYLPLAPLGTATTPMVSIEGRYARPRRGETSERAAVRDCMGVFAARAMDGDRSQLGGLRPEYRGADAALECAGAALQRS